MNSTAVNQFIQSRESIFPKDFIKGELIDQASLMAVLENASWAPTHRFTQPWQFKIYSEEGKNTLLNKCIQVYRKEFGEEKTSFFEQKFSTKLSQSSHILMICMKRDPKESIPEWEEIAAVSCAVQNLHLSLKSHNIGGYWSSPGFCASEDMNTVFDLDPKDKCLGFFYMGKIDPNKASKSNRERIPVPEFTEWINQ